jgi:hypothetical protein
MEGIDVVKKGRAVTDRCGSATAAVLVADIVQ